MNLITNNAIFPSLVLTLKTECSDFLWQQMIVNECKSD